MPVDELSRDEIWRGLRVDLGDELLAELLRVPSSSLAGYARNSAPRAVEERARHLAAVRQHLSGTYNSWGMRRWFERPRAQLEGRSARATGCLRVRRPNRSLAWPGRCWGCRRPSCCAIGFDKRAGGATILVYG